MYVKIIRIRGFVSLLVHKLRSIFSTYLPAYYGAPLKKANCDLADVIFIFNIDDSAEYYEQEQGLYTDIRLNISVGLYKYRSFEVT